MIRIFLALIRLLKPLWLRLGVDVPQLLAILDVKLKMDDRRPNAYTHMRQAKKKAQKNGSLAVMLVSFLMGVFYLIVFTVASNHLMQLFLWFSVFMVMLSITLISDFTSVLIDVKDNFVILPKPVNDKTVVVSRILHIMVHVSKIVVPLMLPAFVWLAVTQGLAVLWFALLVFLLSIFSIFLINAVYLVALKLTTPARFKEILNYIQIIFSIIIFATYYLVPRLTRDLNLDDIDLRVLPWVNLVPTFWFAAAYTTVADGVYTLPMLLYTQPRVQAEGIPVAGLRAGIFRILFPGGQARQRGRGPEQAGGKQCLHPAHLQQHLCIYYRYQQPCILR